MPKKYAFAHPGKIGDFLYMLPTVKYICERDDAIADIYTSEMCRPAEQLVRYQSYVNDFIVPSQYKIIHYNQGVQPWTIPIDDTQYDKVYQLGFQFFPHAGPLHIYIASQAGLETVPPPYYDYPDKVYYEDPYIVVAHCGSHTNPQIVQAYKYFIENSPIKVAQIGVEKDRIHANCAYYDHIGINFLDLPALISRATAYVGIYSSQLAVANMFPGLLKIITSGPSGGEQHGLYIPETISITEKEATGPNMLKVFNNAIPKL